MQITRFIKVTQRRPISLDEALFPRLEHLFEIETHMSMEERIALFSLVLSLPPHFVACEIGSYLGASTSFIAVAADLHDGHLHCVDTWDNRAMGIELPQDMFALFQKTIAPLAQRVTPHRGQSSAVVAEIPNVLDMLFIDGDHSYAACLADLLAYLPKLKPGGALVLHDFDYEEVQRAAREALANRPHRNVGRKENLQAFQLLAG